MATNPSPVPMRSMIATTLGAGLALTVIGHLSGPPPQTVDHLPASTVQEDDPGFDCHIHGNRICGDPGQVFAAEAWQAWDTVGGWSYLLADPDVANRVDYIGTATLPPDMDAFAGYGAIPSPDGWFVFRAVPEDGTTSASVTNREG